MRALMIALLAGLLCGCVAPPTERKPSQEYTSTAKVLTIGALYDLRRAPIAGPSAVGPAKPATAPSPGGLADQREIRIGVGEIRSVMAAGLDRARLFERVLNPPAAFAGATPDAMIQSAQQSSDYLLVGEVNQFHIKSTGFNEASAISIPGDLLLAPLSFATYLTTNGNMWLFCGALIPCWDCEVVLSLSVTLIDAGTGQVAHTIRLEERVRSAYDGTEAFGAMWDESDDWIDLGRKLGEIALHNAVVRLAAELDARLAADRR